jgi:hypothetical protein
MKKVGLIMSVVLFVSCSSGNKMYKPEMVEMTTPQPEWVMKGSAAFPNEPKTVFYGVGVSNSMPNIALLRETADSRARANVASEIKTAVEKLVKDYMDMHTDYFNKDTAGSDEFISYISKSVTDAILINCRIIDRWQDPKTGAFYSLAKMDQNEEFYKQYKEALRRSLSDAHYNIVKEKADKALKDLDSDVEKQRQREKEILGTK